jgi:hypothetical protein
MLTSTGFFSLVINTCVVIYSGILHPDSVRLYVATRVRLAASLSPIKLPIWRLNACVPCSALIAPHEWASRPGVRKADQPQFGAPPAGLGDNFPISSYSEINPVLSIRSPEPTSTCVAVLFAPYPPRTAAAIVGK